MEDRGWRIAGARVFSRGACPARGGVSPVPLFFGGDYAYAFVKQSRPSVTAQSLAAAGNFDRGTDMKFAVIAWIQFVVGLVILGAADYWIRWRGGWLGSPGMPTPDAIWFGVPSLLGLV